MRQMRPLERGFSLLELIIVLAVLMIAALIGFPALQNMIQRSKLETTVRHVATEFRAARLDAIKKAETRYVVADFDTNSVAVWRETRTTPGFTPDDELVRAIPLPSRVYFWGPDDPDEEGSDATDPDGQRVLTFLPSGAANEAVAFRISDDLGEDDPTLGNYLEIRVDPPATGRVLLRKWDGTAFREQGEGGKRWDWKT